METSGKEPIDHVVYSITSQGYAELRNAKILLTLQERTVLGLIDGVCPVAQYIPFLSEFEPVVYKIRKLENLGLLRRAGMVTREAVQKFDAQVHSQLPVSSWQSISAFDQQSGFLPLGS